MRLGKGPGGMFFLGICQPDMSHELLVTPPTEVTWDAAEQTMID